MSTICLSQFSAPNDTALFAAAMEYLREHPGTTLIVEPRTYDITTPLARKTQRDVMASVYGKNPESAMFSPDFAYSTGISFAGQQDITLEAYGATLMIDGFMEPIAIRDCENITLKGITIDHRRRPYSMGRIESCAEDTLIVRFLPEYPVDENTGMPRIAIVDPYAGHIVDFGEVKISQHAYLGNNCWQFKVQNANRDMTGMELYAWHTFHSRPGILIENAKNTALQDVTIHSQPGMGIVTHRSEDILIRHLRVVPAPGSHMSTNTDAVHITSCKGLVRIEHSEFDGQGDDSLNIHSYYHSIESQDGCRVITVLRAPTGTHSQTRDYPDPGDILELTDMRSLSPIGTRRVISCAPTDDPWKNELVLDAPLPENCEHIALVNVTQLPRLEYTGNFCRNHLGRSILIKIKDALVEDNTIKEIVGTGIYVAAEAWWYEGLCSTENIILRRNRIVHCGRTKFGGRQRGSGGICVTIDAKQPNAATHRNIVIQDNLIDCPEAPVGIYVSNTENLILERNQVRAAEEDIVVESIPTR